MAGGLESIRAPLLELLRTATLRHDSLGQEVGCYSDAKVANR
jgi:hypothetical protein